MTFTPFAGKIMKKACISKVLFPVLLGTVCGILVGLLVSESLGFRCFNDNAKSSIKAEEMTDDQAVDELFAQFANMKTICDTPPIHATASKDGGFCISQIGLGKKKESTFASEFYAKDINGKLEKVRSYSLDCPKRTVECYINRNNKTDQISSCGFVMKLKTPKKKEYVYNDKDADGIWDTMSITQEVDGKSKQTHFYVRDGLTWKLKPRQKDNGSN